MNRRPCNAILVGLKCTFRKSGMTSLPFQEAALQKQVFKKQFESKSLTDRVMTSSMALSLCVERDETDTVYCAGQVSVGPGDQGSAQRL